MTQHDELIYHTQSRHLHILSKRWIQLASIRLLIEFHGCQSAGKPIVKSPQVSADSKNHHPRLRDEDKEILYKQFETGAVCLCILPLTTQYPRYINLLLPPIT